MLKIQFIQRLEYTYDENVSFHLYYLVYLLGGIKSTCQWGTTSDIVIKKKNLIKEWKNY